MVWRMVGLCAMLVMGVVFVGAGRAGTGPATAQAKAGEAFFEERIAPVLKNECFPCHHATTPVSSYEGGLLLDSLEGMLKGGDSSEPAIVPGDATKGTLMPAIRYSYVEEKGKKKRNMPPKWGKNRELGGKLGEKVIADFEKWIRDGAVTPEGFRKKRELKF